MRREVEEVIPFYAYTVETVADCQREQRDWPSGKGRPRRTQQARTGRYERAHGRVVDDVAHVVQHVSAGDTVAICRDASHYDQNRRQPARVDCASSAVRRSQGSLAWACIWNQPLWLNRLTESPPTRSCTSRSAPRIVSTSGTWERQPRTDCSSSWAAFFPGNQCPPLPSML